METEIGMERLERDRIVPDVLDVLPKTVLSVRFKNYGDVSFGNKLSVKEVEDLPIQINWKSDPKKFYTLCLIDPDVPSRSEPTAREYVHWIVVNIPGKSQKLFKGETLIEYEPPRPDEGSGEHRLVFVLYEQPSKLDFLEDGQWNCYNYYARRELRRNFSSRGFAEEYGLGRAYAGNYFVTEMEIEAESRAVYIILYTVLILFAITCYLI